MGYEIVERDDGRFDIVQCGHKHPISTEESYEQAEIVIGKLDNMGQDDAVYSTSWDY